MDVGGGGTEGGVAVAVIVVAGDGEVMLTAELLRSQGFGGETMVVSVWADERTTVTRDTATRHVLLNTDHRITFQPTP